MAVTWTIATIEKAPTEGSLSDVCIGWLKSTLGTDRVTEIETNIKNQLDLLAAPVTETGKPWS